MRGWESDSSAAAEALTKTVLNKTRQRGTTCDIQRERCAFYSENRDLSTQDPLKAPHALQLIFISRPNPEKFTLIGVANEFDRIKKYSPSSFRSSWTGREKRLQWSFISKLRNDVTTNWKRTEWVTVTGRQALWPRAQQSRGSGLRVKSELRQPVVPSQTSDGSQPEKQSDKRKTSKGRIKNNYPCP